MIKENEKMKKFELLSPAGNLEKMKTALAFGADAVYAGIPDFSLRVRINDFDFDKLTEATAYCHDKNKKIYATINILAHNKHFNKLPSYIERLKKINIDALIVADPGVISVVKNIWPEVEIHLSTQANCTNWHSAKFWYDQGIKRVVLGREVTLDEIKEINKRVPELELEYFVHGAMCMAYSGRCFLSKEFLNRSANLGDCIQPCRWKYYISEEKRPDQPLEIVSEEHGSYILNSKDLCLLKHVKSLIDAGIVSFKIEGRAKSAYYQAMISGIYSKVINNAENVTSEEIDSLYNDLEGKIVNRGYTEGFLLGGGADQKIEKSHNVCDWEFCGQVQFTKNSVSLSIRRNNKFYGIVKVHNVLKVGDEVEIVMPMYMVEKIKLEKMFNSENYKEINEAHGGQGKTVIIETDFQIPTYSVIRRKQ